MKEDYWRRRDGDQKKGRFIKSDDTLLNSVSLTNFSFMEICDTLYAETDNSNRSVIRPALHAPGSLDDLIHPHEEMTEDIRPPEMMRPVLRPLDFTEDWERQRERATARRQMRLDEEDELELELEYHKKKAKKKNSGDQSEAEDLKAAESDSNTEEEDEAGESAEDTTVVAEDPSNPETDELINKASDQIKAGENKDRFLEQATSMDEIGRQINEINAASGPVDPPLAKPIKAQPNKQNSPPPSREDFIETTPGPQRSFADQESDAMQNYKLRSNIQEQYEARMTDVLETAKARGFEEGYQYGEEKAALELRGQMAGLSKTLSEIITQIGSLKKQVLQSAEQNFQELAQAISIALIGRELRENPDSLNAVIRKAIDEAIKDDEFVILVHPETRSALEKIGDANLLGHIRADDKIRPGEFKIDGSLSVIDGSATELVRNLLDQLDTQLLTDAPKAG